MASKFDAMTTRDFDVHRFLILTLNLNLLWVKLILALVSGEVL